ncbi:hypothetical protein JCM31598_19880 [Desulfonatronum parangueonense]
MPSGIIGFYFIYEKKYSSMINTIDRNSYQALGSSTICRRFVTTQLIRVKPGWIPAFAGMTDPETA